MIDAVVPDLDAYLAMGIPETDLPYRDAKGNVVTFTEEQGRAFWHAFHIWLRVYQREKGEYPDLNNQANISKSCLLGRLLYDGRPPLPKAPPLVWSAPAYAWTDPQLCPTCGYPRASRGGTVGASIDQDHASYVRDARKEAGWSEGRFRTEWHCIEKWHYPEDTE